MRTSTPSTSRPASPVRSRSRLPRRGRPLAFEPLEGRALLSNAPLDPTFNAGQPILTPADAASTAGLDTVDAIAVQRNGQIVVAGRTNSVSQSGIGLAVRRYNADGTPDTSFGTNGEADIPLPGTSYIGIRPLSSVLIGATGTITVAANISAGASNPTAQSGLLLARLTSAGAIDTSFGTGGEALPTLDRESSFTSIGQLPDGRIVLGGTNTVIPTNLLFYRQPTVVVLADDGAIDPTFHGGTPLNLDAATFGNAGAVAANYLGLVVTPQGQIAVAYRPNNNELTEYNERVAEFNADGTLATSFGTGGILVAAPATEDLGIFGAIAVDPRNGDLVLAVDSANGVGGQLLRFTATGQADPTFSNPTIISSYASVVVDNQGRILVQEGGVIGNIDGTVNAVAVRRYLPSGAIDTTFGPGGQVTQNFPLGAGATFSQFDVAGRLSDQLGGVVITPTGQVLVAGTLSTYGPATPTSANQIGSQGVIVQFRATNRLSGGNNDYDGDNTSDFAAAITALGALAYRKSTGGDVITPFGIPGVGLTVPAPGDYDGDGKTDVAAYLPTLGILAYRPSSGGADVYVRFGPTGVGNAIPVPGDYDDDGKTDVALYLPGSGTFIVDPSGGGAPYPVQFGAGGGLSIPVPGDYDGDGKTDLAVYIPVLGEFFDRPTAQPGAADRGVAFGPVGAGASIPAPGDYQGTGHPQFALYLPSSTTFAVLDLNVPAANFAVSFSLPGVSPAIPVPGDYDGDGKTDFAVYLPLLNTFLHRPSGGGPDIAEQFGVTGVGQTVPTAALAADDPTGVTTMSFASDATPQAAVLVPLVDGLLDPSPTKPRRVLGA